MQGEPEGSFSKTARIPPRSGAEDSVELNAGGRPAGGVAAGKPREIIQLGDDSVQ